MITLLERGASVPYDHYRITSRPTIRSARCLYVSHLNTAAKLHIFINIDFANVNLDSNHLALDGRRYVLNVFGIQIRIHIIFPKFLHS
jgi:hypothetical protein